MSDETKFPGRAMGYRVRSLDNRAFGGIIAQADDPKSTPTSDPTEPYRPMNRHARRKAAALARKGGGR